MEERFVTKTELAERHKDLERARDAGEAPRDRQDRNPQTRSTRCRARSSPCSGTRKDSSDGRRIQQIATEILTQLSTEGSPVDGAILHALVDARIIPAVATNEFEAAIRFCVAKNGLFSIGNALRGLKYQITDTGEGALLK